MIRAFQVETLGEEVVLNTDWAAAMSPSLA